MATFVHLPFLSMRRLGRHRAFMKNDFARHGWLRLLLTTSVVPAGCLIGSYVMARVLVALNGGFGAGDVPAFFYSTIPFAVVLLLPAPVVLVLLRRVHPVIRLALALVAGVASGFIWTVFNRWMLGPCLVLGASQCSTVGCSVALWE